MSGQVFDRKDEIVLLEIDFEVFLVVQFGIMVENG
jgi:hypothetical protein